MQRHDAPALALAQNNMATHLTNLLEAKPLERFDDIGTG